MSPYNPGRFIAGLISVLAMLAALMGASVASAPNALASDALMRIEVSGGQAPKFVSDPMPDSPTRVVADSWRTSVRVKVTFTGSATYSVNGGAAAVIASGIPFTVPISDGVTAVAVTHGGSTYPVEILRPWSLTGIEIYNARTDELVWARTGANFDPARRDWVAELPNDAPYIKWRLHYNTPTEPTVVDESMVADLAPYAACEGVCDGTKFTTERFVDVAGDNPIYPVRVGWSNRAGWGNATTIRNLKVIRLSALRNASVSDVSFGGVTLNENTAVPGEFTGAVPAPEDSVAMTATFTEGSVTWSVNGSDPVTLVSGRAAVVPMVVGLNTVTVTETTPQNETFTYTYQLTRAVPLTGVEVRDAGSGSILFSSTGQGFDLPYTTGQPTCCSVPIQPRLLVLPSSVTGFQVKLTYPDPPADGATYRGLIAAVYSSFSCPGSSCESGEWSNTISMNSGQDREWVAPGTSVNRGGATYWPLRIVRATSAVSMTGISIRAQDGIGAVGSGGLVSGTTATAYVPSGITGTPVPTVQYQWQVADSADGTWADVPNATGRSLFVSRSFIGKVLRVRAIPTNGVSADGSPVFSPATGAVTAAAPPAPQRVSAVPGDTSVTVSWIGSGDPDIVDFTASAVGGGTTRTCQGTTGSCEITGLTNGTQYSVTVVANYGPSNAVSSAASAAITVTPGRATAPALAGVAITGTPTVGNRLTSSLSGLSGTPAPVPVSYTWQVAATSAGPWTSLAEESSSLLVGQAVEGRVVRVVATARNTAGVVERTSAIVGPIAGADGFNADWSFAVETVSGRSAMQGMAVDSQGYVYVSLKGTIRKYAPRPVAGEKPVASWSVPVPELAWWGPGYETALAVDPADNLWAVTYDGSVFRIRAGAVQGDPVQFMFKTNLGTDIAVDANHVYICGYNSSEVQVFEARASSPKVRSITAPVHHYRVNRLAVLRNGNVLVSSSLNDEVLIFEGGATGSDQPISRWSLPREAKVLGVTESASGRIWFALGAERTGDATRIQVYNPNPIDEASPVADFEGFVPVFEIDANASDPYVYFNLPNGSVIAFDEGAMGLPPVPVGNAPAVSSVAVAGVPYVNETLAVTPRGVAGRPTPTASYQWQRADHADGPWTEIYRANKRRYTLTEDDRGKRIRVTVELRNAQGSVRADSAAVGPVESAPSAPISTLSGESVGLSGPNYVTFVAGDRIAVKNASSNAVTIVAPGTGPLGPEEAIFRPGSGAVDAVSGAHGGGVWVTVEDTVQLWEESAPGDWTMTRKLVGPTSGYFNGADRVIDDANGYVYVSFPYNKVVVFAPDAASDAAPVRQLPSPTDGIAFDGFGNVLIGADWGISAYPLGGSGARVAYTMNTGVWVDDLAVDSEGRIYSYYRDGTIRVYFPGLRGDVKPAITIKPNAVNQLGGVTNIAASPTTDGLFAIGAGDQLMRIYNWSNYVPAVPQDALPSITGIAVAGAVAAGSELTASITGATGYPMAAEPTFLWEIADSASGPWTSIAGATGAKLFVPNGLADRFMRVTATSTNRSGSDSATSGLLGPIEPGPVRTPVSVVAGSGPGLNNPWFTEKLSGDRLLVSNRYSGPNGDAGWLVFAKSAVNGQTPVQRFTVAGDVGEPWGATQIASSGNLLVSSSSSKVYEVASNASGAVIPLRTIDIGCAGADLTTDAAGLIYASCFHEGVVKVFAAAAAGASEPLRVINIEMNPSNIGITGGNTLYVGTGGAGVVRFYELGSSGSGTPTNEVYTFDEVWGVDFDATGRMLVSGGYSLRVHGPGFGPEDQKLIMKLDSDAASAIQHSMGGEYYGDSGQWLVAMYQGEKLVRYDVAALLRGDPPAPSVPTGVTSAVGNNRLVVNWRAVSGATKYRVSVTGNNETFACVTTQLTCTFRGGVGQPYPVANGTEYTFTVKAYNGVTPGPDSAEAKATVNAGEDEIPPNPPTEVVATGLDGTITVSWKAPAGSKSNYRVRVVGVNNLGCGLVTPVTATRCSFANAAVGRTYTLRVTAIRAAYPAMISDPATAEVLVRGTPKIAQVTIRGTNRQGSQLTGTAPVVTATPAAAVQYVWQASAQARTGFKDVTSASRTLEPYDLQIGDVGDYIRLKVIADNNTGDPVLAYSNVIGEILTRDGETKEVLFVVDKVEASVSGTTATVDWVKPRRGNPKSYTITLRPSRGSAVSRTYTVTDETLERYSFNVSGLAARTTYSVTVQVQGQDATRSPAVSITTPPAPDPIRGVVLTVRGGTVTARWTAPTNVTVSSYAVTLTPRSGRSFSATVNSASATISSVARGNYTLRIIATSDQGVAGQTYTHGTAVSVTG